MRWSCLLSLNVSLSVAALLSSPVVTLSLGLPSTGTIASSWSSISSVLSASSTDKPAASAAFSAYSSLILNVEPTHTFTNVAQASSITILPSAPQPTPGLLSTLQYVLELTLAGVGSQLESFLDLVGQEYGPTINSVNNVNPDPPYPIYPSISPDDAPYSLSEQDLRRHIYIPSTFTYGKKQPVILSPGTGAEGGADFIACLIPLLQNSSFGDPVWINPPSNTLADAQVTAEIDAYAINYIAALSGRNVAVITESQGSVDVQWALKYWPSTRSNVTDFIPISGDLKGVLLFNEPMADLFGVPAIYQQRLTGSNFISTLRANNGSSAYVPTTSIWTATDEIVQPQQGNLASAYVDDVRMVGVTNNQIQTVCPLLPAGLVYGHVDILVNPLVWALIEDALTHDGPGQPSRLDLLTVCSEVLAPGLTAANFLALLAVIPLVFINVLEYEPKMFSEPPIMAYAAL